MFEENPKWTEIGKIIVEIREEIEKDGKDETVFIVTRDERTSRQINDFLSSGMFTNTFQIFSQLMLYSSKKNSHFSKKFCYPKFF